MMKISKQDCKAFRENPRINPITGRKIEIGKITHSKLSKACNNISPSPRTPSPTREVPPMGPMIHWKLDADVPQEERNNLIKFYNHIKERLHTIKENKEPVSIMEMNDFKGILREAREQFADKPKHIEKLKKLWIAIDTLLGEGHLVNDEPVSTTVIHMEIKGDRVFVRGRILRCFRLWESAKTSMEISIESRRNLNMGKVEIHNVLEQKKYIDYIIKHKIFTYNDIYIRTFKTERPYEELKELFEKYKRLYKSIKGSSP